MLDNFSVGSHTSLQNKAITRIFGFKGFFLKYTKQFVLVYDNGINFFYNEAIERLRMDENLLAVLITWVTLSSRM